MPRHAKSTKDHRDRRMVVGLTKHARELTGFTLSRDLQSAEAVAARYQAHLDAMERVGVAYAAWRTAVQAEQRLEVEVKALHNRLAPYLISAFAGQDAALFDFGLKPRKKAKIGTQKMLLTVAKRNATRKARKTMGKRQKKAIKGAL
jgi:hypothetical protein